MSVPQPLVIQTGQIGSPIKITNNGSRWGSAVKPLFKQAGLYKGQVFESPNQIQTLIDNTQPGADAALTVSAAGTTQGAATLLARFYNKITTVATGVNDGVRLPNATPGAVFVVEHAGVGILKVYPAVSTTGVYAFTVSSASAFAAIGATFTNNGQTFTVVQAFNTRSENVVLFATGTGAPSASGTLTKATGQGSATITFSSNVAVSAIDSLANNANATYANPGTIVTFACLTPGRWSSMVW
ncbi:MAG: hypothetical protein ACK52I_02940 [Pseudomonadota bacterium]